MGRYLSRWSEGVFFKSSFLICLQSFCSDSKWLSIHTDNHFLHFYLFAGYAQRSIGRNNAVAGSRAYYLGSVFAADLQIGPKRFGPGRQIFGAAAIGPRALLGQSSKSSGVSASQPLVLACQGTQHGLNPKRMISSLSVAHRLHSSGSANTQTAKQPIIFCQLFTFYNLHAIYLAIELSSFFLLNSFIGSELRLIF